VQRSENCESSGIAVPNCRSGCAASEVSEVSHEARSRLYLLDIRHAWDRRYSLKPAWAEGVKPLKLSRSSSIPFWTRRLSLQSYLQRLYEGPCFVCKAGKETGPPLRRESTLLLRVRSTQGLFHQQARLFPTLKPKFGLPRN
jgi:hypothetical protein